MNRLPLFLLLALAPLLAAPGAWAQPDKKLDAAVADLRSAIGSNQREARQKAIEALVALEDPGAVAAIQGFYAEASQGLRGHRDDLVEKTFRYERKREMLALMEVRAERDASLEEVVKRLRSEARNLGEDITKLQSKVSAKEALCEDLGAGTVALFDRFASGATKKAAGALWKDAEDHPELGVRIAAVEMLGRVGGKGTPLRLHKLLADVHKERLSKKKQLPKLEQKVREFERRYQEELNRNNGRGSQSSAQQYERLRSEPASLRRELHKLAFLADATSEAAGRALGREQGEELDKTLKSLTKTLGKVKGGLRLLTLDVFAHSEGEAVAAALRGLLSEETEPLLRAEMIDALARLGDQGVAPALLETHLVDASWHVRSRAASALASLRSKDAIGVLIERLEADQGRVVTDVQRALESLTGERFGTNVALWKRWWADHAETFEVSPEPVDPKGSLSAEEAIGVTFFGIKTESERVLFIFDVSGSMNFSMVPRNNPNDDTRNGRQPDMPRDGEDSRLDAAKRELVNALGAIGNGGVVNIVLYATDVWSWQDDPTEVDTETRSEVIRYVEALTAAGGTNIYGALRHAFDLAGVEEGGEWSDPQVDTIYLLSDGRASAGVTTDPDQILGYVRERNRTAGITIHTIGLSGAQDAYLLRSLAEQNGGQYVAK